jgi:hypothetical protein
MARGEFCLHLCDDDDLIPEIIADIVEKMRNNANIGATFSIFKGVHVPTGKIIHDYKLDDEVFSLPTAARLAAVLSEAKTPVPENAVYRTDIAVKVLFEANITNYVYVVFARFLMLSDIHFFDTPFYLLNSFAGSDVINGPRESEKFDFAKWTLVSRGFVYFYYWATGSRAMTISPGPSATACLQYLRQTYFETMDRKEYAVAVEIMQHIDSITDVSLDTPDLRKNLIFLGKLDLMVKVAQDFPGGRILSLVGFAPEFANMFSEAFGGCIALRGTRLETISLIALGSLPPGTRLYLTPTEAIRRSVLQIADAAPGEVYSLETLDIVMDLHPRQASDVKREQHD